MEKRVVITFCGDYSPEEREEILENLRKKTKVEERRQRQPFSSPYCQRREKKGNYSLPQR